MANRKSSNRRSSKYSKGSVGSDVLDPNTDILGDEQPYWWRNLENNTIARPSTDSTVYNQTSRRLNSDSSIRTSKVDDGWWKILEGTTRTSKSLSKNKDQLKNDADNRVTTMSESDEETIIAKRKPQLQTKARKTQTNAFLNALNDSKDETLPKSNSAIRRNTSSRESASVNHMPSDAKHSNKSTELNLSSSYSSSDIVKTKPKIFRNRQRTGNENAFGDVLKENKEKTLSTRKSIRISSVDATGPSSETKLPVAANSPVIAPGDASKLPLLSENDPDLSNISIPKASSTQLGTSAFSQQDSTKDSNNSDTEHIVLKPKLKLLKRRGRLTEQNAFEKVIDEETSDRDKEDHDARESAKKEATLLPEEDKPVDAKVTSNAAKNDLDTSSDTSDTSSSFRRPSRLKSKFLNRPRRSPRKNPFQRILETSEDSTADLSKNSRKSNLTIENVKNAQAQNRRSSSGLGSQEARSRSSRISEVSDVEIIGNIPDQTSRSSKDEGSKYGSVKDTSVRDPVSTVEGSNVSVHRRSVPPSQDEAGSKGDDKSTSRGTRALLTDHEEEDGAVVPQTPAKSAATDSPLTRAKDVSKRLSGEPNDAPNPVETSIPRQARNSRGLRERQSTNEGNVEDVQNKSSIRSGSKATSSAVELDDTDDVATTAEHKRLDGSQKRPMSTDVSSTPRRRTRRLTDSRTQLTPTTSNKEAAERDETGPRRSRSFEKLQRKSSLRVDGIEKTEESVRTPSKRQSKGQAREAGAAGEAESPTRRRSNRFSEVEKQSTSRVADEMERAQTPKGRGSSSSRTEKQTALNASNKELKEIEDASPRRSKRFSEVEKQSTSRVADEMERAHTPKGRGRSSSRTEKQTAPNASNKELKEIEDASPRRSKRFSEVEKQSTSREMERAQTPKGRGRSSSRTEKQTAPNASDKELWEIENSSPRRSKRHSEVEKQSTSRVADETERAQTPKGRGRSSSRTEKQTAPNASKELKEIEDASPRRSKRHSSMSRSAPRDASEAIESAQTPTKWDRSVSKTRELRISLVPIDKSQKTESAAPSPRRRSHSIKRRSRVASESEGAQTPRRQSKVASKAQAKEDEQAEDVEQERGSNASLLARGSEAQAETSSRSARNSQAREQTISPIVANEKKSPARSDKSSVSRKLSFVTNDSEKEESPSKQHARSASQEHERTVLTPAREEEPRETETTSRRSNRSSIFKRLRVSRDSDTEDDEPPPKRLTGSTSHAQEHKVSWIVEASESSDDENAAPSMKQRSLFLFDDSESDDSLVETEKEDGVRKGSVSRTPSEFEKQRVRISSSSADRSKRLEETKLEAEDATERVRSPRKSSSSRIVEKVVETPQSQQAKSIAISTPSKRSILRTPSESKDKGRSKVASETRNKSITEHEIAGGTEEETPIKNKRRSTSRIVADVEKVVEEAFETPQSQSAKPIAISTPSKRSTSRIVPDVEKVAENVFETPQSQPVKPIAISTPSKRSMLRAPSESKTKGRSEVASDTRNKSMTEHEIAGGTEEETPVKTRGRSTSRIVSESATKTSLTRNRTASTNRLSGTPRKRTRSLNPGSAAESSSDVDERKRSPLRLAIERDVERIQFPLVEASEPNKSHAFSPIADLELEDRAEPKRRSEKQPVASVLVENENATRSHRESANETGIGKENVPEARKDASSRKIGSDVGSSNVLRKVSAPSASQSPRVAKRKGLDRNAILARVKSLATASGTAKGQRNIEDFFRTDKPREPASQILANSQKMVEIRRKLEEMKQRDVGQDGTSRSDVVKQPSREEARRKLQKKPRPKQPSSAAKEVNRAFLVNGLVYKKPRLPRPRRWITDRLYRYLWKLMEPKYKMETRVVSERFVRHLTDTTKLIEKQKSYLQYKAELHALMKEMARLGIVRTRCEFYNFCHDFLPYDLRVKMVPMLLPGNRRNIPFEASKLHEPILRAR